MKANKIIAIALAVMTMVGIASCDTENKPEKEADLALDQTSMTLTVDSVATLTATVEASWETTDAAIAEVKGNGKTATVTAKAEGNAIITATTADGQVKTCVVLVQKKSSGDEGGAEVKGSQIWPVVLDAVTAEAVAEKIAGDLRPNDETNFLYIWAAGETYAANENPTGLNFYGNQEGYIALTVVAPDAWSGLGFCLTETGTAWQAAEELRKAIVANPDQYFLHMALKSTDHGNHQFYVFNNAVNSFAIGTATIEAGEVFADYTRDGSWAEFDIPMSMFANNLAGITFPAGGNIFCALSGASIGVQLNMDAIYFYKK